MRTLATIVLGGIILGILDVLVLDIPTLDWRMFIHNLLFALYGIAVWNSGA